ncbi:uncharacterized protein TRIVIDRAFT_65919 [Trichoderma virens Gv29-8]|uniref:Uncharacterized protein n=1 Tax=Hypocrea virens (strain Gv29-8 / FGSC 10586) TaxID=413071 RepID=G9N7I8_HYPVG|nr:uncharacterized protein TRIVIDRAFT_65919 [Trichoderma virens Gv29-8]EHK16954.1 hypothetical protein TRIVIDRAFT_65919 [Trichoderma virens Gv29-8]
MLMEHHAVAWRAITQMSIDSLTPRVKQHSMTVSATDNTSTAARPPRHGDLAVEDVVSFMLLSPRERVGKVPQLLRARLTGLEALRLGMHRGFSQAKRGAVPSNVRYDNMYLAVAIINAQRTSPDIALALLLPRGSRRGPWLMLDIHTYVRIRQGVQLPAYRWRCPCPCTGKLTSCSALLRPGLAWPNPAPSSILASPGTNDFALSVFRTCRHNSQVHPLSAKEAVLAWRSRIWLDQSLNPTRLHLQYLPELCAVSTLHSSAASSGRGRHPAQGWSGIRKGYHPVMCCRRIEMGEHMWMEHKYKYEYLPPTLRSSWPRPGFMLDRRLICFARYGLAPLE